MTPPDASGGTPDWDGIVAHTCHMTGWTWDYVEEHMTVPRLRAMHAEWRRNPPVPLMVAAYLGITPKEEGTPQELVEFIRGFEKTVINF